MKAEYYAICGLISFIRSFERVVKKEEVGRYFFGLPIAIDWRTIIEKEKGSAIIIRRDGFLKIGLDTNNGFHANAKPAYIKLGKNSKLIIEGYVDIHKGTRIWMLEGGKIEIGHRSYIANDSTIIAKKNIKIGEGCAIAWNVVIQDTDFHDIFGGESRKKPSVSPINIGNRVWIAAGARVLKGVTIGDGAIVGANAVVTTDVPENTIVAGNPARVISKIVYWR